MSGGQKDRRRAVVKGAVARACDAFTVVELMEPDEAGGSAANLAFENALEREARKRPAKRAAAPPRSERVTPRSVSKGDSETDAES